MGLHTPVRRAVLLPYSRVRARGPWTAGMRQLSGGGKPEHRAARELGVHAGARSGRPGGPGGAGCSREGPWSSGIDRRILRGFSRGGRGFRKASLIPTAFRRLSRAPERARLGDHEEALLEEGRWTPWRAPVTAGAPPDRPETRGRPRTTGGSATWQPAGASRFPR